MSDPLIVLREDTLILAGRVAKLGDRPISLHMKLRIEPDEVAVAVESVDIGSLPLPKQFVQDQLAELRHRLDRAAAQVASDRHGGRGRATADLARLGQSFSRRSRRADAARI